MFDDVSGTHYAKTEIPTATINNSKARCKVDETSKDEG